MSEEKILKISEEYAKKEGFILNKDKKHMNLIISALSKNQEKYGYQFCPCRVVTGDFEEDRKIVCPCIYHKDEIKQDGHCKCKLFFKKE